MEIKQLVYFLEAYKMQSFTEAAKNCIITTQGLHVSISRLEAELGCKLFFRTETGLHLTSAGEYLLPKAMEIIKLRNETMDHFLQKEGKDSSVTVFFIRGTVEKLALPSIADFRVRYPDSEVFFKVDQDIKCMQAVLDGNADFAICSGPVQFRELSAKLLFSKNNVLVINKNHPLSKKESVSVADLKDVDLALPRENVSIRNTFLQLCRKNGFDPKFTENDEPRTAFNCAEMGLQAGIVNEISAKKLLKDALNTTIIPFSEPEMRWDVFLVKKKDAPLSKAARAYESCLRKVIVT